MKSYPMDIREGKVEIDGSWYSAEELTTVIQERLGSGDYKVAHLSGALEALGHEMAAREKVTVVLSGGEVEILRKITGGSDRPLGELLREMIKRAVAAPTGQSTQPLPSTPPAINRPAAATPEPAPAPTSGVWRQSGTGIGEAVMDLTRPKQAPASGGVLDLTKKKE